MMELTKDELKIVCKALAAYGSEPELLLAFAVEIEKRELEEVDFDEDDGCAGGACKL
jgi:hypothetical protein